MGFTNIWEQNIQGREKSQGKYPGKGVSLICSRKNKEVVVTRECAMEKSQESRGESDWQFLKNLSLV